MGAPSLKRLFSLKIVDDESSMGWCVFVVQYQALLGKFESYSKYLGFIYSNYPTHLVSAVNSNALNKSLKIDFAFVFDRE